MNIFSLKSAENKNIQPGLEKQHSYEKEKSVIAISVSRTEIML